MSLHRMILGLALCCVLLPWSGCIKKPASSERTRTKPATIAQPAPDAAPIPALQPAAAPEPAAVPQPVPAPEPPAVLPVNAPGVLDPSLAELAAQPYAAGELAGAASAAGGGRTKVRTLYSFEDSATYDIDGTQIPYMLKFAENIDIVYVRDNGVTDGIWCARCTVEAGQAWGSMIFKDAAFLADWSDYDYFAFDLYMDEEHPYPITFELWDGASKNYPTRCTFDGTRTRQGKQTLMWPINRAKRNSKEGRDWEELEPQDKIDMQGLKIVKVFTTPTKERRQQFWIDNLRLMQEDAAVPKLHVSLPATARAFDFGSPGSCVEGLTPVAAAQAFTAGGCGFTSMEGLAEEGKGWPDQMSGTFVMADMNRPIEFKASVPAGDYRYWLLAGPVIDSQYNDQVYRLSLNNAVIADDQPSFDAFDSVKYVHRFMWTQYSERPHAAWLDYVDRMYPVHTGTVTAGGGTVTLQAANYFLAALILVPAAEEADFNRLAAKLRTARLNAFEAMTPLAMPAKPSAGTDSYCLYVPETDAPRGATASPSEAERSRTAIKQTAAAGQNVIMRVSVVPARDLGACELRLADLTGPAGVIPAAAIKGYFQNYRFGTRGAGEMILLPALALNCEAGITQHFWLWLTLPADTSEGVYKGNFQFVASAADTGKVPVELTVLPFTLDRNHPASFGMYGGAGGRPSPKGQAYLDGMRQRYEWMAMAGFTGTGCGPNGTAASVNGDKGTVSMRFDDSLVSIAMQAGLGARPAHMNMVTQLGIARGISRRLQPNDGSPGGAPVDRSPGIEFEHPQFKACWQDAMRQYKAHLESTGMAYAIEIVDEPREVPNPWNRNLKHTCLYGDWMAEAGFTTRFVTPMSDGSAGLDYTELVNHTDIMSIHAGHGSAGQMRKALAAGKTLWFYNSGMSRYMWGAYPWRTGATGRWEWHWCAPDGVSVGGYPGAEWYNPFTAMDSHTCAAPWADYPGGFLCKAGMFTAADGMTDYAYMCMLAKLTKAARASGAKADVAAKAEALMAEIRNTVPEFPHDKGAEEAAARLDDWRAAMGRLIVELR